MAIHSILIPCSIPVDRAILFNVPLVKNEQILSFSWVYSKDEGKPEGIRKETFSKTVHHFREQKSISDANTKNK